MKQLIISVLSFFLVALFCDYVYAWTDLESIFGADPTYPQWLAIEFIVNLLLVGPIIKTNREKNDSKGSKVPLDLP